jgi:hypothetical protein
MEIVHSLFSRGTISSLSGSTKHVLPLMMQGLSLGDSSADKGTCILHVYGIHKKLIELLEDLQIGTQAAVRMEGQKFERFALPLKTCGAV